MELIHVIDLKGMWFCVKAELAHFLDHGAGSIVNKASGTGLKPTHVQPAYSIAKAGVVALTRQAALEYVADGIRVNGVAPGLTATPALAALSEDVLAVYAANQPTGKIGQPIDIAETVAWLLSDEASYVTGLIHLTDGGFMLT